MLTIEQTETALCSATTVTRGTSVTRGPGVQAAGAVPAGRAAARAARPGGADLAQTARSVYGRLRKGFYGLEMMLVTCMFLALLREPRAESATLVPPAVLGRVLGPDRASAVKTICRKLAGLAAAGKAAD